MSKQTIAKISIFVITALAAVGCEHAFPEPDGVSGDAPASGEYAAPVVIGTIASPDIDESSGVAASRCQDGVLWTHNDGADGHIYAFDRKGKHLGAWKLGNIKGGDWEDMAIDRTDTGECRLYIGSIGNNELGRKELSIYRLNEPAVSPETSGSSRSSPRAAGTPEILRFTYSDGTHDAESLLVHPQTGDIYVITKKFDSAAGVYRIKPEFGIGRAVKAERVGSVAVPAIPNGFITGGAISPDGTRVALSDYFAGYEMVVPTGGFDEVWKQKPVVVNLGERSQGEAIGYSADGSSLIATSENPRSPLIEVKRIKAN